jgi:hypothetical protein
MPKAELERKDVLESEVETVESVEPKADRGILDASDVVAQVATVAVVGIGCAATIEAALLPGFVLGVAAMWAPKFYPKMGEVSGSKVGTFSYGLQAIELVLGAVNLTRRPLRASRLRTRSRQ